MDIRTHDQKDQLELSLAAGFTTNSEGTVEDGQYVGRHHNIPLLASGWERSKFGRLAANLPLWNKLFLISCVIAVSVDPLFFYIPKLDDQYKCIRMDSRVRAVSLGLRSLTDSIFLLHFVCQIYNGINEKKLAPNKVVASSAVPRGPNSGSKSETLRDQFIEYTKKKAQKMSWLSVSIVVDFLSLIPIPQFLIEVVFYTTEGPKYFAKRDFLNFLLLAQYVPRIYEIQLSSKKLTKSTGIVTKGVFNFFLYILASHVIGAFWYFFSVQREISCWRRTCISSTDPICMNSLFCSELESRSRNITILNEYCSLSGNDENSWFDFGLFSESISNHITGNIDFIEKFWFSFWWGLRNLSNFGTNLMTSRYTWESLFAVLISLVGLLLFLYLIGNVQTFMQMETTKSEEIRREIQMKMLDVLRWISRYGLSDQMKKEIIHNIKKKKMEGDKDANLENLFSILPAHTRKALKRCLSMNTLRKVPKLANINVAVLKMMCDDLTPVTYKENSFVFRMGDPLDCMILIVEGTLLTYSTNKSEGGKDQKTATSSPPSLTTSSLGKGQLYGGELLSWASPSFTQLPMSTQHVKTHRKVEAFALMAKDLTTVVSRCTQSWYFNNCNNRREMEEVALSTIITAFRHRFRNLNPPR